jgi:hypothetical protein
MASSTRTIEPNVSVFTASEIRCVSWGFRLGCKLAFQLGAQARGLGPGHRILQAELYLR